MGPPKILAPKEGKVVLHLSITPSSSSSKIEMKCLQYLQIRSAVKFGASKVAAPART